MKANKFFVGLALVGAILTACEKEPETPVATGEVSYVSVNLNYANQGTRADAEGDDFEYGLDTENNIEDVTFFFFDEEFKAYPVNTAAEGDQMVSYYTVAPKMNAGDKEYIEKISDATLVVEKSKITPPSYILAVANCPTELQASLSLSELQAKIGAYNKNGDNFIMANSVYKSEATGEAMYVTPISNENLAPTSAEATNGTYKPIEIYIERTAAKVRVNNFAKNGEKRFKTGIKTTGTNGGVEIWAEVTGWHVTDVNSTAYLLKKIDTNWTSDASSLGFAWNEAGRYRSYWATSTPDAQNTNRHPYSGDVIAKHNFAYDYYYENTTATEDNRSQLIVTAKFYAGETETQSIDIAEWWGVQYTLEDLKTAIANSLASQLYVATETEGKYESITPDYIAFEQDKNTATDESAEAKNEDRYWSNAVLAKGEGLATEFFNAQGKALSEAEVTAIFKGVRHAKIWSKEFGGYYYLDIEHLGTGVAQYGLVRNHLYDYTLTTVNGLGTPIFDGNQIVIPEKPEGEETYISAKLNVQAWRLVSHNDVVLE